MVSNILHFIKHLEYTKKTIRDIRKLKMFRVNIQMFNISTKRPFDILFASSYTEIFDMGFIQIAIKKPSIDEIQYRNSLKRTKIYIENIHKTTNPNRKHSNR